MLILHETYDHWSVAVLTVTVHFIYSHFWFFFQIGCFLHWIQSVYSICFVSLIDNGSPLYLWWPSGLLCWWIFIVSKVVLNMVFLSIFSGLAALMSADIARTYDHWSVAVLTVTVHFIYSHFWFFIQIGCFLNWIQSVYSICFVSLIDNGSTYIWPKEGNCLPSFKNLTIACLTIYLVSTYRPIIACRIQFKICQYLWNAQGKGVMCVVV